MEVEHLYIHIPFCQKKCLYCDFYSETRKNIDEKLYLNLLLKELKLRKFKINPKTIYFGGGTPSLLSPSFFENFLKKLDSNPEEITIEVNPETISKDYLRELKSAGITRVSIGIQTLNSRLLKLLGRNHTAKEAIKGLESALSVFENVSADLMFAIPDQTEKSLLKDLEILTEISELKHISIYGFTLYENTPLFRIKETLNIPDESRFNQFYRLIVNYLKKKNFLQYEISNFSKPGFECKHNLSYWFLKNYIGLGPSGASFIDGVYYKNISNLSIYTDKIEKGLLPCKITPFSFLELLEIKLGMGLRTVYGVKLKDEERDIIEKAALKSETIQTFIKEKVISWEKGNLRINPEYFYIHNFIAGKIINEIYKV